MGRQTGSSWSSWLAGGVVVAGVAWCVSAKKTEATSTPRRREETREPAIPPALLAAQALAGSNAFRRRNPGGITVVRNDEGAIVSAAVQGKGKKPHQHLDLASELARMVGVELSTVPIQGKEGHHQGTYYIFTDRRSTVASGISSSGASPEGIAAAAAAEHKIPHASRPGASNMLVTDRKPSGGQLRRVRAVAKEHGVKLQVRRSGRATLLSFVSAGLDDDRRRVRAATNAMAQAFGARAATDRTTVGGKHVARTAREIAEEHDVRHHLTPVGSRFEVRFFTPETRRSDRELRREFGPDYHTR